MTLMKNGKTTTILMEYFSNQSLSHVTADKLDAFPHIAENPQVSQNTLIIEADKVNPPAAHQLLI